MTAVAQLIALLAPPACAACGAPLAEPSSLVCGACLRALRWLGTGVCRRCGQPWHRGRSCPARAAAFSSAWSPVAYAGPGRDLVHALKFRAALPLAGQMAAQMTANAPGWALGGATAVVPVPPARWRRRRRGFDPAAVLAREVASRLGLPLEPCLRRPLRAPRQMGAGRSERRRAGRVVVTATRQAPEVCLLIDDVHTTGSTLDACSRALRSAGARRVHAVTYARAL